MWPGKGLKGSEGRRVPSRATQLKTDEGDKMGENKSIEERAPILELDADSIDDDGRIRSQVGDIKAFARKLKVEGQLNPITFEWVSEGIPKLNTGARRVYASKILALENEFIGMELDKGNPRRVSGPGRILARDVGGLTEIERLQLELSENLSRKDFTKSEEALGISKLQKLLEKKEGKPISVSQLADKLRTSVGQVGMGLKVARAIEKDPQSDLSKKLLNRPSIKSAHQLLRTTEKLKKIKQRAADTKVSDESWLDSINHNDGIEFLANTPAESVDFIYFDPPWGIGVDSYDRRKKHETFNDEVKYAWDNIITPMVPEMYRVLKTDTWSVVWFGIQFYEKLSRLLSKAGFEVDPVPVIWYKTNKGGSQNDPDVIELNVYEPFFRIRKGEPRLFKKPLSNVIPLPMDYGEEREHYAQKPLVVGMEILERYTFGNMLVVDPTYGSGRIFKACQKVGRRFAGAEKNEVNRETTIRLLREQDSKRHMA